MEVGVKAHEVSVMRDEEVLETECTTMRPLRNTVLYT